MGGWIMKKRLIAVVAALAIVLSLAGLAFALLKALPGAQDEAEIYIEPLAQSRPLSRAELGALMQGQLDAAAGRPKPQMGWSSWNLYHDNINEEVIMRIARGMKESGLVDAGYQYLNIDDCWQTTARDEYGRLQFDAGTFPSREGIVKRVNDLGIKLGIYSSAGVMTCEDKAGSLFFEEQDAKLFAEWGVEYLKYDYCRVVDIPSDPNGGNAWPTETPPIQYIGITPLDGSGAEVRYIAEEAVLAGTAAMKGGAVYGLGKNGGTAAFIVKAPAAGAYALCAGYDKTASGIPRFAQAEIGGKAYELWFPRSEDMTGVTARVDVDVILAAGENNITLSNPIDGQKADTILRYRRMADALQKAVEETPGAKPILFSVCEHGRTVPWTWAPEFSTSWRTSGDIRDEWASVKQCYEIGNTWWEYQRPGAYNDPDMLEVGVGNLNAEQNRSHFSLWAMMSAPLLLACDTSKFVAAEGLIDYEANNSAYDIITNREIIALSQDDIMLQAKRVSTAGGIDVLVKPLTNGEAAVCFFNKTGPENAAAVIDLSKLNSGFDSRVALAHAQAYLVKNLWEPEPEYEVSGRMLRSGPLAQEGVAVFRIKAAEKDAFAGNFAAVDLSVMQGHIYYAPKETVTLEAVIQNFGAAVMNDVRLTLGLPKGSATQSELTRMVASIAPGSVERFTWEITLPGFRSSKNKPAAELRVTLTADYAFEGEPRAQSQTAFRQLRVASPLAAKPVYVSDAPWITDNVEWGTTRRDRSIDGNRLRLGGSTYKKGIGTHTESTIELFLGKGSCRFQSDIGVDEEIGPENAKMQFYVFADGKEIFRSEVLHAGMTERVDLEIHHCRVLTLHVKYIDSNAYGHANWADAKLTPIS